MKNNLHPNSTQIPNILLDWVIPNISEAEVKCLLYICRRTYGFQKERDRISISQFVGGISKHNGVKIDSGCGVSRPSVVEALRNLVGSGLLEVIKTGRGNYYQIIDTADIEKIKNNEVVKKVNQLRKLTKKCKESKPKQYKLLNLQNKGNKVKQSNSETSSPVTILRDYFLEECKTKHGFEPEMAFGKEGRLLKEKLKRFRPDQVKDLINQFLNSKVGADLGYSLSICLSAIVINQWLSGKLGKKKKPHYDGFPMAMKNGKWFVIKGSDWLEFAGRKEEIIYK